MRGAVEKLFLAQVLGCHIFRNRWIETLADVRATTRLDRQNITQSVEHFGNADWAICAYGSIARGDYSSRSDCDLMLLLRIEASHAAGEILRSLGRLPRLSISTILIDQQHGLQEPPLTLRRLSALHHLKFICGDVSLFVAAKKEYTSLVASLSPMDLVLLWHGDVYRPARSHYNVAVTDLKKSAGGTIDYDFGRILQDWILLLRKAPPQFAAANLGISKSFLRFLCVAKSAPSKDSAQLPPSSLLTSGPFVSLMAKAHRKILERSMISVIRWCEPKRRWSMDTILKLFSRMYVHATFIVLGAILVVISIVAKIPGADGGEIVLRQSIHIASLVIGSVFALLGLGLAVYTSKSSPSTQGELSVGASISLPKEAGFDDLIRMPAAPDLKHERTRSESIEKPFFDHVISGQSAVAADGESSNPADLPRQIRERFVALSPTQKRIVGFLYRIIHSSEISVDDVTKQFNGKYSNHPISGPAEMYYRLSVLGFLGFVIMRGIGERSTMVVKIEAVGAVLLNGDLLDS